MLRCRWLLPLAALIAACLDSPTTVRPAGPPAALQALAGDGQSASVGTEVPQPLVVRVVDSAGRPVPSEPVTFSVVAGGGAVLADAATNDSGTASAHWTLGTSTSDSQQVEAAIFDGGSAPLAAHVFQATAISGPAVQLEIIAGDSQSGFADSTLAESLAVRLVDRYGNAVTVKHEVVWTAGPTFVGLAGAAPKTGTASPAADSTDGRGVAHAGWTLGPPYNTRPDTQTVIAAVGALPPVAFASIARPIVMQVRVHVINAMPQPFDEYTLIIGDDSLQTGLAFQGSVAADTSTGGNRGQICLASAQARRQRTLTFLGVVPNSTGERALQQLSLATSDRDAWADSLARGTLSVAQFEARLGGDLIASTDTLDPIPLGLAPPDTAHWIWRASGATAPASAPADTACRAF